MIVVSKLYLHIHSKIFGYLCYPFPLPLVRDGLPGFEVQIQVREFALGVPWTRLESLPLRQAGVGEKMIATGWYEGPFLRGAVWVMADLDDCSQGVVLHWHRKIATHNPMGNGNRKMHCWILSSKTGIIQRNLEQAERWFNINTNNGHRTIKTVTILNRQTDTHVYMLRLSWNYRKHASHPHNLTMDRS